METAAEQEKNKSREHVEAKGSPETDVVSFEGKEGEVVFDATVREGEALAEQSAVQAKDDKESAEDMEQMMELADIGEVTELKAINAEAAALPKQEQAAQAAIVNEAKRTTENAAALETLPGVEDLIEIGDRDAAVQPQDLIEIGDFTSKREGERAAAEAADKLEFAGTNWVDLPKGEEAAEAVAAKEGGEADAEQIFTAAELAAFDKASEELLEKTKKPEQARAKRAANSGAEPWPRAMSNENIPQAAAKPEGKKREKMADKLSRWGKKASDGISKFFGFFGLK